MNDTYSPINPEEEKKNKFLGLFCAVIFILALGMLLTLKTPRKGSVVAVAGSNGSRKIVEVNGASAEDLALAKKINDEVVPEKGFTIKLKWGSLGKKVVEAGAIDLKKYDQYYKDEKSQGLIAAYLTEDQASEININKDTAYFWVNTLWALGLVQKSTVLDDMKAQYPNVANLAATGGWSIGAKDAMQLYGTADIIPLTGDQQTLVKKISENIYRPCCNNSTAFPDCNHGMAALGLVELMVSQNFSETDIYRVVLEFNSYWFTSTYADLAFYFQSKKNITWKDVDAKLLLSKEYSSASGYRAFKQQYGGLPTAQKSSGGSCGA